MKKFFAVANPPASTKEKKSKQSSDEDYKPLTNRRLQRRAKAKPITAEVSSDEDSDFKSTKSKLAKDKSEIKDSIVEISPEDFFGTTKRTKAKITQKEPTKADLKRKLDTKSFDYMVPEEVEIDLNRVEPPKSKAAKKKSKSNEDIHVTRAINAGIKVMFGKDLEDVEKSTYRAWETKAPASFGQSRSHPKGVEGSLETITFVMTGDLPSFSREDCTDIIKRYGGRVTSAVSSKTTFLIVGDNPGSSKISKAKQFNTAVLDEDAFVALVESYLDSHRASKIHEPEKKWDIEAITVVEKPLQVKKQAIVDSSFELAVKNVSTSNINAKQKAGYALSNDTGHESQKPKASESSQLWTDKYKPTKITEISGNKKQISDLTIWLQNWHPDLPKGEKAALISGLPGIGKTTTAHVVAKSLGKDIIELNASDARNKESVKKLLGVLSGNHTILEYTTNSLHKHDSGIKHGNAVIIMDEVDGMSAGDRGGTAELIKIIQDSKVPIICICNDRMSTKVRSLANHCVDIKFFKPQAKMLRSRIMSICAREGLRIDLNTADQLADSTNADMRQILNLLQIWKLSNSAMTFDQGKTFGKFNKKEISVGPFDVIGQYLNVGQFRSLSLQDKINLYFNDFSLTPLMIHENYMANDSAQAKSLGVPSAVGDLMMLSKAAESIAEGDILDSVIHSSQNWGLLPNHAVMSCVRPAFFISGRHNSMYTFPSWLGKNSSTSKNLRLLSEISSHMRCQASGDRNQILMSYLPTVALNLMLPLINEGTDGIPKVISFMDDYDITREDWDAVNDLILTPKGRKPLSSRIDTKVRSAFTRTYNKMGHKATSSAKAIIGFGSSRDSQPDTEDVADDNGDSDGKNNDDEEAEEDDKLIVKKSNPTQRTSKAVKPKKAAPKSKPKATKSAK